MTEKDPNETTDEPTEAKDTVGDPDGTPDPILELDGADGRAPQTPHRVRESGLDPYLDYPQCTQFP